MNPDDKTKDKIEKAADLPNEPDNLPEDFQELVTTDNKEEEENGGKQQGN